MSSVNFRIHGERGASVIVAFFVCSMNTFTRGVGIISRQENSVQRKSAHHEHVYAWRRQGTQSIASQTHRIQSTDTQARARIQSQQLKERKTTNNLKNNLAPLSPQIRTNMLATCFKPNPNLWGEGPGVRGRNRQSCKQYSTQNNQHEPAANALPLTNLCVGKCQIVNNRRLADHKHQEQTKTNPNQ